MAQTMYCDGECGRPAALLIQIIDTPEILAFCPPCSGVWAEGHAASIKSIFEGEETGQAGEAGSVDPEAGASDSGPHGEWTEVDDPELTTPPPDTPADVNTAGSGADASELPLSDELAHDTSEGGAAGGSVRRHDSGLHPGGGSTPDQPGSDDPGGDRREGQGSGRGSREGGRDRRRSARGAVEPQPGP